MHESGETSEQCPPFPGLQNLAAPEKEEFACFRNITIELKALFDFQGVADSEIGHGEENSKHFGGDFGNLTVRILNLPIPASQTPEVGSDQGSVQGNPKSWWNYRRHARQV
jgi:hypothetical protein